jgi:hypothetical protein
MNKISPRKTPDEARRGREIFEITPVALGGDPNKVVLTRDEHIRAVAYWNKIIHELREKSKHTKTI